MSIISPITLSYIKEKWQHAGFQKYLQNMGWMFGSRVLCMVISFLTTAFIARRLGPENFGQLSYAISFISIFSILATLGIDNILYRDLIRNPDKKLEFLGSAVIIKLLAGFFTAILISISALFFVTNDVSKILILILSGTFIFNAFQIINYEFQARVKSKYPSIITLIITLILNVVKVIIVLSGNGVIYLAGALLFESILYATFYWFIYERKTEGKVFEWKFNKQIAVTLLTDSWPLIFTGAFALIYARIDQIFIKHILNSEAVGIYDSAVRIAEVWYFIPAIIITSLFPAIVKIKDTSTKLYNSRMNRLTILLLSLAVIIAIPTTIFATLIIKMIYGIAFIKGAIILKIYVWSNVGAFANILAVNYLVVENKRKLIFMINFIPMAINIILNILLIPEHGIVGSAYATLISYTIGPLCLLPFLLKKRREATTTS